MTNEGLNHPKYLVDTDWLEQHLDQPSLRIFDCTVNNSMNPDPVQGKTQPFVFANDRANYSSKHIPGAGYIDVLADLSDLSSSLPMMAPSERQFAAAMQKYGISNDDLVVLYSTPGQWAARVWWMLRSFGFNKAVILSGGLPKWVAEGRPVSSEACTYTPGTFKARIRTGAFVGKDDVLAAINDKDTLIINSLPAMMHTGEGGGAFGRKGHISGSVNVPFGAMHDPDTDAYLPIDKLKDIFDAVDVGDAKRIILYCGAGIGSTNDAFALTMLGYENVSIYDASLSEWGNDETLPMDVG
ncbi:MAG: sulfurtransferase [Rhodospirillales bacterium]|jgi:thiosulfate/3-mercaptopyruvate sulfurtransferase|nr:sulfurtransferase [Rhodospirillales bacterium]MBT4040705.1 sulfurtransferase [Rhodospirillales bacterium]MBT4626705.1 sulfurtransferase [Rhodospirillales bacterium]MBT5353007.1 sulfurtransferase [Rhodospirillales bacterium]MBT5519616.1 sulfurtransferase [Rhodospirillales bacterium]